MAQVQFHSVSKRYGESTAVDDITLDITQGAFTVLLGPSGCGKTTTLRMLAGFVQPTSGRIEIGGRDVTQTPPWLRNTGLVFQSYALFPHMTVAENVAFGLDMRKLPKADSAARVREVLDMVRMGQYADRLPRALSGGQQQRVALARALAVRPDVLLLDEPLSNLDAKLRAEVRVEIRELQQRLGLTTVMVTHDQEEALTMADQLVVMAEGRIRQTGNQYDLYERPADRFVADFVGRSNFLEGEILPDGSFVSKGGLRLALGQRRFEPGHATFALRPEQLTVGSAIKQATAKKLASGKLPAHNLLNGQVTVTSYLGAGIDIHVMLPGGERMIMAMANRDGLAAPKPGDTLAISWPEEGGLIFQGDRRR
ncbi:MAG: ABC transporter ATP-binding protein [Beijerinckiaceae bacterium]